MSRHKTIAVSIAVMAILVGTALAFSNISLVLGTMPAFDFGSKFGGVQPATVQFHTFTMKPGDTVPWHYHKALSYVVLERGTLTETHVDPNSGACVSEDFSSGTAFIEEPDEVHTVSNTGKGVAVITWATAFPTSDGVAQLAPQFTVGGIYFAAPPNCN